ncbi:MAG: ABC transporter permease, partial [Acidobacteriota bacterium]
MENVLRDLKFALRVLWKEKGFTVTVLLTLVICLGANTALFSVVRSVLLQPLPFPESNRVLLMYNSYPNAGAVRGDSGATDYYDRLRDLTIFEQIAMLRDRGVTVGGVGGAGGSGSAERLSGSFATPSFFDLMRTPAWRGRLFNAADGEIGAEHEVILSHALWQRLFAGRDDALGKDLRINGLPYTVVGVMPPGFHFVDSTIELWMPLAFTTEEKSDDARHSNNGMLIGRLKPGATLEQARSQVDALNARNLELFPHLKQALIDAGFHTVTVPLQQDLVRDLAPVLYLLWGGVLCVLLIGCVNITNLVLVRSSARLKELATRQSLGAGTARIARQLLTETTL